MGLENRPDHPAPPEMAALIRDKDWSGTPLGAVDTWSPNLRLVVQLILASGFPMAVRWGPDFVMIYNDGYRAILGDKHPWALGLPFHVAWPEVQDDLRSLHESILSGERGAFFGQDFLLRIQRRGAEFEDARFTISYSPIPDDAAPSGVGGVLITVVETTDRVLSEAALRASEAALRDSEANLRLILDSATDAVYCVDTQGTTTQCNVAFLRMLGIEKESDAIGRKLHDVIHHTHPDGTPYPKEECPIYRTAMGGPSAHRDDELFYRFDGTAFPVEYWVAPILRDGVQIGAVCTFIDISARKQSQEQQTMLLAELNHRVKNLFALTGSMISLSARSATSVGDLATSIRGRVDALAAAHDLVLYRSTKATGEGQSLLLMDIVQKILSPYALHDEGQTRIALAGPEVQVGAKAVTNLALVLHELSTNSAKYGALSVPEGRLAVTWAIDGQKLSVKWEESGGPPVAGPPTTHGFGTLLANHSVRGDFSGSLNYDWREGGLVVDLDFQLDRLAY
jgi:PAS domain S-box-containing protein